MIRITDIQNRLKESEGGVFQKVCNEILSLQGYKIYKLTGSVIGSNKTKKGTPDSVYIDKNDKYIYVEITTDQGDLAKKIKSAVKKCLDKINNNVELKDKVSRIIFLHNQENIDELLNEKIRTMCGNIKFDIFGIEIIASLLQTKFQDLAITELGVRDDFALIDGISEKNLDLIAQKLANSNNKDYGQYTLNEIKNRINDYYEQAIKIINTNDAMVEISVDNKNHLKSIFDGLKALEFYYKDKNDDYSKQYYHNMLVIISKYNYLDGINYYNNMPKYAQKVNISTHFYSMLLIEKGDLEAAKIILEDLYFKKNYVDSFETLLRTYFLLKKYEEVIKILSPAKLNKYDKYGFLASMLVTSKNIIKKYSETDILKLNNSKFKKMPLFYTCTAKMLYDLDKRKNKYKEQFKKGIKYLSETDVIAIVIMCNQAMEIKLEDLAISYLESISLTPVLQKKLIELLSKKNELTEKQIELLENIDLNILDGNIDTNYLNAKILESKGKELRSIELFKESFDRTKNINSAYKYIQLSIKNKSKIEEKIIREISEYNSVGSIMISSEGYRYIGKYPEALNCSYKAIYMSNNTSNFKDAYRQFWTIIMMYNNASEPKKVTQNCVVKLKNNKNNKIYLLEDDYYFDEGKKVLNAEIIRSNSYIGLELLQKEKNDIININEKEYKIVDIFNKYAYFAQTSFRYIKNNKYIKVFISKNDDPNDSVEQIKQEMISFNKNINNKLDIYQNSKSLPLSSLIGREKGFEEYAKLINTLLLEKDRILLAGETIDLDLSKGFVIDISTLIVLSIMDVLDIIPDSFCNKIYITTSLKNKFKFFYDNLIRKSAQKENMLYVVDDNKLFMKETLIINQINFWKKLNKYINMFKEVNIESEKDEIFNKKTENFFDKVQFDLIELAKEKNIPLLSDDLIIRRLCNYYSVKHTNVIQIIKTFAENEQRYLDILIKFSKNNYIYTLYFDTLSHIIKDLYDNFNEKNKKTFISIISSVLENKVCAEYYIPILMHRVANLRSVQYFKIFNQVYENIAITFIINEIDNIVTNKCEEFGIKIGDYI